ncbi:sugar ABC transporter permease [Clostridia bacterium]|nr:sugar ABC transporter permease [Clostridia bacterium]
MTISKPVKSLASRKSVSLWQKFTISITHNWQLYVLLLPALIWLIVFCYAPMYGVTIAFKDYNSKLGIMGSPFAGLKYFRQFFSTNIFTVTLTNTLAVSGLQLGFGFPIPILFALLLNQLRSARFQKVVQTVSYAPYFISNVVVVSILSVVMSPSGFVNGFIQSSGKAAVLFMSRPQYFRPLYVGSGIWQSMGFNAIIYLAALAGVSPDLHEAAIVDGASKIKRIIHIDLPTIAPTIIVMLILAIGNLMSVGYEKAYLMQNGMNTSVSELISTYVYKAGLVNAQYSFATAVGLFNSVTNLILLSLANIVSRKTADIGLF